MKKSLLYFLLFGLILGFTACGDDDDDNHNMNHPYEVTIAFMMPMENAALEGGTTMHIHVDMTHDHGGTIHNAKIELMNSDGSIIDTPVEEHVHETSGIYSYHNMTYPVPLNPGVYTIKASTTDHDGANEQSGMRTFTVE